MSNNRVIIVGGGPAGLAAAIYMARAELKPLLILGNEPGGQVVITNTIENYPGFKEGISGQELFENLLFQAEKFGTEIVYDSIFEISQKSNGEYVLNGDKYTYSADYVLIATGATSKKLNVTGESELVGRGVSYCATCDGFFFKDKEVIVVGGGDSALEEALFLTRYAKKITLVHRKNTFRASKILQKRVTEHPKISIVFDAIIDEISGENKVEQVSVKNVHTGEIFYKKTDGVFIFIGHTPNSEFVKEFVDVDEQGYVIVDKYQKTSKDKVYAAGEISDPSYRQVATSTGFGVMTAMNIIKRINEE